MAEPNLHGVRVLIVEDDSRIALISDMLEEIGWEVVTSSPRLEDAVEKQPRARAGRTAGEYQW